MLNPCVCPLSVASWRSTSTAWYMEAKKYAQKYELYIIVVGSALVGLTAILLLWCCCCRRACARRRAARYQASSVTSKGDSSRGGSKSSRALPHAATHEQQAMAAFQRPSAPSGKAISIADAIALVPEDPNNSSNHCRRRTASGARAHRWWRLEA